jgi:hypothetical protein
MAGYAATGRIVRAHPRFVGSADRRATRAAIADLARQSRADRTADPRPLDIRFLDWWSDAREEWAQATFFLFDPESWR